MPTRLLYEVRVLQEYSYMGRLLGRSVQNTKGAPYIESDLSLADLEELLENMPVRDKLDVKRRAPGVFPLVKMYRLNPIKFIDDASLAIYVMDQGFTTPDQLKQGDRRAWLLVRKRGIEAELFEVK